MDRIAALVLLNLLEFTGIELGLPSAPSGVSGLATSESSIAWLSSYDSSRVPRPFSDLYRRAEICCNATSGERDCKRSIRELFRLQARLRIHGLRSTPWNAGRFLPLSNHAQPQGAASPAVLCLSLSFLSPAAALERLLPSQLREAGRWLPAKPCGYWRLDHAGGVALRPASCRQLRARRFYRQLHGFVRGEGSQRPHCGKSRNQNETRRGMAGLRPAERPLESHTRCLLTAHALQSQFRWCL